MGDLKAIGAEWERVARFAEARSVAGHTFLGGVRAEVEPREQSRGWALGRGQGPQAQGGFGAAEERDANCWSQCGAGKDEPSPSSFAGVKEKGEQKVATSEEWFEDRKKRSWS